MVKWFIDKNNKVPLYLQLKDLIRYYIATGAIEENQQLPTVNDLAKELGVNFETIRKAYKELEREGLISTSRGRGTFANGHVNPQSLTRPGQGLRSGLVESLKNNIRQLLQAGTGVEEVKRIMDQAVSEVALDSSRQFIVFTECNTFQIREISELLRNYLNLPVKPVLLKDLRRQVENMSPEEGELLAVITTGFHVNEVHNSLADLPVRIDFLVINMSPETRRALDRFDESSRFGFICRDQESIPFYKDMLKAELGIKPDISSCTLSEDAKVKALLESVDVLLVSPPVYEEVKRMGPPHLPVFNVFDRVDPMSLRVIKERIMQAA